ncbi:protein kinase domain-containing protein [Thalassoglobus neptunius]|uniref:protein kinase domain-containing protein n=1 Tax=Thalassoglobus neptunius TaxID=1938619 RepID=UPI0018D21806|nr:protein kinase [Thalassoglobus neptunius]
MNNHDRSHHPERAQRVQELFIELVELPEDERKLRLKEVALADATLAQEVDSLLAHHREDSSFLEDGDALKVNLGETQIWRTPPVIPGFQSIRQVAEGGQAVVFQGRQESTNQLVAIKVLKDNLQGDKSAQSRHLEEIRTLTRIQHPNIVSIVDCGVTADGREYYITRYISGYNLDEYIKEKSPKLEQRVALCAKIARAVDAAHKSGIIHRDLKPSNIRIDRHGEPYVLDFGLAKGTDGQSSIDSNLKTVPGSFVGSVPWASPEQVNRKFGKISAKTDIYQLGVVFYQVFASGEFPYPATGELLEAFHSILDVSPKPLPDAGNNKKLARIETVLLKALNKKPNDRFSSARAFARMLEQSISIPARSQEPVSNGASRLSILSWMFLLILFLGGISGAGYMLDKYVIPGEITNLLVELKEKTQQAFQNQTPVIPGQSGDDNPDDDDPDDKPGDDKPDDQNAPGNDDEVPPIDPVEPDKPIVTPPPSVPEISIAIDDAEINEGDSGPQALVFPVTLSKASTETIRVRYTMSSQNSRTPADQQDYQPIEKGTLTFEPGETDQSIEVNIVGDEDYEPHETFSVQLTEPENAVISRDIGIGTILNDDPFQSQPGKLDFQQVESGQLPDDWEIIGNTGVDLSSGFPALKIVGSGKDENAVINRSIRVADKFFIEMQLVDEGNDHLEFNLKSSETGETSTFEIGTKSVVGWTLVSGSTLLDKLAPSSSGSRDVVWFRIENRPDEGLFVIVNGDLMNAKKFGAPLTGPFDSLEVRFDDPYRKMSIHNLRWGPISPTRGLQTVEFGNSQMKIVPSQLPEGWTRIGPANPDRRTRWISDPLQIGDEFLASFRINVLRRGEFQLNFIGEGGSMTLPVSFDFGRSVAVMSACGAQRNFEYRLTNYEVRIRKQQDKLLVTVGDSTNTLVVDARGFGNFEQIELDVSPPSTFEISKIWIK